MHIATFTFIILALLATTVSCKKNKISSGLSCKEKRLVVDTHNQMRQQVASGKLPGQPKASNMQKIVWDDKLAKLAQNHANKMKFQHSKKRKDKRFSVGENIYVTWSTGFDTSSEWNKPIEEWFGEHEFYSYEPLVSDPATGHYTQIVWADTMYIGCGYVSYQKGSMIHKLYVCNYGPAGNMLTQYPYQTGAGCENLCCKSQCERLYGNQC